MLRGRVGGDEKRAHKAVPAITVHSSSFHEPGRISTRQGKQYSTNTDYMRQNETLQQMNDPLLLKCMCNVLLEILLVRSDGTTRDIPNIFKRR